MPIDPRNLVRVQGKPDYVRNICVLAHVDHGKTSLSDCLIATNGVISQQLQGQIRYLDSRPDEQMRGITMESSAISIYFKAAQKVEGEPVVNEFLLNLIDSPGHIDFSSEVSTASRLCDGAVVLVDAVEGVCSQTIVVLRQSWDEQLRPLLVINKIDRLIAELQMSTLEAAAHLEKLVEQVNAVIGSFYTGKRMEEDERWREAREIDASANFEESSDEDIYFAPQKNNVVFASAIDGWGFTVSNFAAMYEAKLGVNRSKLEKFLWGNYFLDPKTKKVSKKGLKNQKTLFVQFILDNIWGVYNAVGQQDNEKIGKIVKALDLKISDRELKQDSKGVLTALFNSWIPVSRAVRMAIVATLPSPVSAQRSRTEMLLKQSPDSEFIDEKARLSMQSCDSSGPAMVFVSKVMHVRQKDLSAEISDRLSELRLKNERANESGEFQEVVIGVSRVYSGTIEVGQELDLLSPKYSPKDHSSQVDKITVTGLYVLMGRDLIPLKKAYAGTIVGIAGLGDKIVKSGTLVSPGLRGPNFARGKAIARPILMVAVEPEDPVNIPQLEKGLELLNASDPCVEVTMSDTGEYILATAGELHLERCLKDLSERFAGVDIDASQPVVPYRETIVAEGFASNEEAEYVERGLGGFTLGNISVEIHVLPLPEQVAEFLTEGTNENKLEQYSKTHVEESLSDLFSADTSWKHTTDQIVAFGPKHGPNLLIDASGRIKTRIFSDAARGPFDEGIMLGFQAAMAKGPLVSEPVQGVACVIRTLQVDETQEQSSAKLLKRRLISLTRSLILKNMEHWSPRLKLATYLCEIQATSDALGKVYAVVTRRRGKVLTEDIKEGMSYFTVTATVPVVESFGFSEEIRRKTSGAANPQLVFDGFRTLDLDPYWVPTTEEELEALGDTADKENVALVYVRALRKHKGLATSEKLVDNSEQARGYRK